MTDAADKAACPAVGPMTPNDKASLRTGDLLVDRKGETLVYNGQKLDLRYWSFVSRPRAISRDELIDIVMRETTDAVTADGVTIAHPNILEIGCRHSLGRGYEKPAEAARTFAGFIADAVLKAGPFVERGDWSPVRLAPQDGTTIQALVVHRYAPLSADALDEGWIAVVEAKWIDHNGGGWTWEGLAGTIVAWRPLLAVTIQEQQSFHARQIAEEIEEGSGFWKACSGCQEGEDGHVSQKDYPYNPVFRCQPGGGCSECGGLGVLWDNTDYDAMARAILAEEAQATCQACGGRIEGWICQGGSREFRENDAGELIIDEEGGKAGAAELRDAAQGVIDWCDIVAKRPDDFRSSRPDANLRGPAFDKLREALAAPNSIDPAEASADG